MPMPPLPLALVCLGGYLLGSIPFGLLLTKIAGGPDIRSIGSGNIGATNVLRTGNKKLAAATLLCDMLKATAAVVLARLIAGPELAPFGALCAFLGHLFPIWLRFKGGKGVATYIGALLGLAWPVALGFCAVWLLIAFAFRYSSLSALVASALTPAAFLLLGNPQEATLFLVMSALLWFMHRANIGRLLRGEESRIGRA